MHPSQGIKGMKGSQLQGKKIVLGITGSIAAVECLELARELIRYGAEVHAVMSAEGAKIITPYAMQFATGNDVITELDGRVQHVSLLDNTPDKADLLLIAPCTANTLSKIACGIDDTPVTTMATIAIGSKIPVLLAPAMHASMFENPMVRRNIVTLCESGIGFVGPRMEEKKAKIATVPDIVAAVLRYLGDWSYEGLKVLVIGGSSEEPIDDMRVITNRSTGETAVELAKAAYEKGAVVDLWMGRCQVQLPPMIPVCSFRTVKDLIDNIGDIDHDLVLVPAALSDFAPKKASGKIPSEKDGVELSLGSVPKVLPLLTKNGAKVIGFKAESGVSGSKLAAKAKAIMRSSKLAGIVANDLKNVAPGRTKVIFLDSEGGEETFEGTKSSVARDILSASRKLV
ncbi:MAG TPA: bifunctional phosphopantothenoylcysteine decarboxylase/phosphopantothenate--cysteine ligase CoaBC [Methanomassiliicoccales archaeon]|nr:bifunctional phosphopantothenoylcysteine decarboxylase/phosphopantothenate--cysteine ligase CoaBC [Methanomassiliicoccales archaeon]